MANDDVDLDAMLDSALDAEFAAPASPSAPSGVSQSDGDGVDLDAMLDEAMEATGLESKGVEAAQGLDTRTMELPPAKASSGFGPSQQWLQRQQGRENGGVGAKGGATRQPFPFLRPGRRDAWKAALAEDARHQEDMDKQRPFSRAYRSFYSPGKVEGDSVLHVGSGAARKVDEDSMQDSEGQGEAGYHETASAVSELFDDVFGKGLASSGVKEAPSVEQGDFDVLERLKASYLRLVVKDVRARVSKDPDVSPDRFPGISSKILA